MVVHGSAKPKRVRFYGLTEYLSTWGNSNKNFMLLKYYDIYRHKELHIDDQIWLCIRIRFKLEIRLVKAIMLNSTAAANVPLPESHSLKNTAPLLPG